MHGRLRARPGAVVARRHPARLQRQAPGARHGTLPADHGRRHPARSGDGRRRRQPGHQRPRGLHPRQRVHPRRIRRPRLLRRRRVLRPRHRRRGRDRAPDGDLDRRGRARARPVEDGHPAVRAGLPEPGIHARPLDRELRHLLRHPLPERGAPVRAPAADLADLRDAGRSRRRVRREVGLGAAELVRDERTGRRRGAPAARLGGRALVARDRRRGARDPAGGRPVRRDLVRQDRDRRAWRGRLPAASVRQRRGRAGRADRLHAAPQPARRHRVRPDRHPGDRRPLPDGHRDGVRAARSWLAASPPARRRQRAPQRHHLGPGVLRAVGPAGPRHPRPAHARRRLRRRLPVPHRARHHRRVRARLRAARDVRRRARLGAVRPHRVRAGAVADAVGRRPAARPRRRRLPGDRRAAAREGLPRLVERHHPRRDAVRGGARVRGGDGQGARVHRAGRARRREGGRAAEAPALPRPRRPALDLPRQRAGPGRWRGGGPGDHGRLRVRRRALDRVRVPAAGRAAIGTRGEVEVFGEWIGFEVVREPLYDPEDARIRS